MVYPWQTTQWQFLWNAKQANRLPHGLLFTGLAGTGKALFAETFARALLCKQESVCEQYDTYCHACRLIANKAHPNVLGIEPEKQGAAIKIDQIREANEFIQQSSLDGEYRLVLMQDANYMNANAANALLKTLEEPASGSIIILICDQTKSLPATILSRCQRIVFPAPAHELAHAWLMQQDIKAKVNIELILKLAHGAPLTAIKLLENDIFSLRQTIIQALSSLSRKQGNPVQLAESLQDAALLPLLDLLCTWLLDILRLQVNANEEFIVNSDYVQELKELQQKITRAKNTNLLTHLEQLRSQVIAGINFNKQLLLEEFFVKWMNCYS